MTDVTMLYHDFSNGHERSWKSTVPHHFNALNNTPTICIFIFIQIISVNTIPNHHWGNVPGSFFIVVSTLQIFQQRTFAGRPILSFHHPPIFCMGYSRLESPACSKQPRGLEGSGNELSHPCRENLETLESSIGTSCWSESNCILISSYKIN